MALAILNLASQARFSPGQVVVTTGVDELVRQGRLNPSPYLRRHLHGDWGDLDDSDRRQNDAALKSGEDRLFSSYQVTRDLKLWIITEWDRSVTTLLLPSEYWRRQCKATFQTDKLGVELVKLLGIDNIMWGNDYPHPDGIWPNSKATNADQGSSLTPEEQRKVFYGNAARMYGIGDQAFAAPAAETWAG